MNFRGVSGYLKLDGQVVMWRTAAAAPPPGGAFYSAKNWVGNCPLCPPATYSPVLRDMYLKTYLYNFYEKMESTDFHI
jgi:hypothetical protein